MRPDSRTNQSFLYCLAVAAKKYDVDVLFTIAMSNHHHTGIHDKHGNFPKFIEYFHKLVAKCMNAHRGRWENFWSSEQTNAVRLISPEDILNKLVYALTNPVKAALVDHALEWPGVSSLRAMLSSETLVASRPEHFFRANGPMPHEATVTFARPPGFESLSDDAWRSLLKKRIALREERFRKERLRERLRVAGVRKVLHQRWWQRPRSNEPRRRMVPRVASTNKWRRIEALRRDRAFLKAYRAAWQALKADVPSVPFPPGTYWLSQLKNVSIAVTG